MLENKWNNIAPEVPQDFHNKFEDTLKQIEQADSADKKYKRKKNQWPIIDCSSSNLYWYGCYCGCKRVL
ncbi:MAG: hypothetical protein ACLTEB_08410 [Blautia obeum]